ncbi:type III secretion system inner rod subunit SctI [Proteus sp. WDL240414]|uniref:Type III secretion protein n=2 Tax=Proteus TaxID=583 RepID=A0A6I7DB70_9GAMM|nr:MULTISPECIES: type III secretion system inner rod subunit SctI [Proteus]MBG2802476.1 type III secretion system inner rod subunit SctI [Proteus mirabilis]MBG3019080.1 type III secretion system inner rod subunit SctI [Proteus mirabilis]MBG3151059.1 type III secretion system inner rod subunit SctI [Proteus mirabilis]QHN12035.1 type III secretion protein [Proteus columbae]
MAITPVVPVHLATLSNDKSTSDDNLSSIMVNSITSGFQYEKQIQEKLTTLSQLSDVQSYTQLQTTLNDYTITMNLASTLARKSLNIVETLLKAQ